MSESKYIFPKRLKTSYAGEATKGRSSKPEAEPYEGLPKKRASDGPASQWLLLYPLRPSVDTDLIGKEMAEFGDCRMVRSTDGYYAICEYREKADAVEAKSRFHYSHESWVLRKERASGYWTHKAATGLKIDSVSRPKALECLAKLGFPAVAEGWDSILLKPQKRQRFSDFCKDYMARIDEAEHRANLKEEQETTRKEDIRRRRRAQLGLPDYDSFDEDFDITALKESDRAVRRSQVRSQLGVPDYDSFDEDF